MDQLLLITFSLLGNVPVLQTTADQVAVVFEPNFVQDQTILKLKFLTQISGEK